jgi:peptide/nickel transport system substrate-binding protein
MNWTRHRFLFTSVLAALALGVSACGDDEESADKPAGTPAAPTTEGKQGGTLRQLGASDVDYMDPGHTYFTQGYQVLRAINRPLYAFKPGDSVNPVPDLAEGDPQISDDKKSVTVKIRTGVKYAPPVNRDVKSADVKYAFERFFSVNVGGQYPGYFNVIVGSPEKPTKGVKPISGIETPDDQTIVFRLKNATAVAFAAALVMPLSVPVPEEYAKPFDAKNPSTYNTHVAMTGPYMIKNNSKGELTGWKAGKSIDMVRNPNWDKATDFKPAYVDRIFMRVNATDGNVAARQVLNGKNLLLDTNPPANILKDVVTNIKDQYEQVPSGGFRWFPINTTIKPFDNLNVRKAILAGFDRNAARLARGGKFTADLPTHFLPPEFPGFEEAGGFEGPGFDFINKANEKGDDKLAAEYLKKAGYPSGKYTGDETFLMVTVPVDPGKAQAEVAKRELEELGFKFRLRITPQDATYTEWCQVPDKKVAVCGAAGWFKDFSDPQSMLEPTFKGSLIMKDGGNNNLPQLNDPKIDAAMDAAALLEGDARLKAWGEIDKMITGTAAAIPFVWDKTTLLRSKNVNAVSDGYIALWDFTFTSIK